MNGHTKSFLEGISLALVGGVVAKFLPIILGIPGAIYYLWLLIDKWGNRK